MEWCLWAYRKLYWCKRQIVKQFCQEQQYQHPIIRLDDLPWFWIGIVYPDTSITVTTVVNQALEYGVRVTPEFLTDITGFHGGVWRYMDAKTLEEKDFPSAGFIIEDVLDKSLSDSE
jgi:hypothetical protein